MKTFGIVIREAADHWEIDLSHEDGTTLPLKFLSERAAREWLSTFADNIANIDQIINKE